MLRDVKREKCLRLNRQWVQFHNVEITPLQNSVLICGIKTALRMNALRVEEKNDKKIK